MKIKDTLVVFLQERVIIFPFHLYIDTFLTNILNKMYEWNLLSSTKKISGEEKYFKYFVEKEISSIILDIKIVYKEYNFKIFSIFKDTPQKLHSEEFLQDKEKVINSILRIFKKLCKKYFNQKIPQSINFKQSNKSYKGLAIGEPTGEEIEFLTKII